MRKRRTAIAAAISILVAASAMQAVQAQASPRSPSPASRYIVTLTPGSNLARAVKDATAAGDRVTQIYGAALLGYAADMTSARAQGLARNPNIALVEPDQAMSAIDTQSGVTWGLDRIDQRSLPLNGTYTYDPNPGAGVSAYVIDTGVRGTHADFGGRVTSGYSVLSGVTGLGNTDCNGHGTHVAGTIAGSTYGVAKAATVVPVRVLDCNGSGYVSDIVAGINWVINVHAAGSPAVANMSLGGGASTSLDSAVANLVSDGVTVAVAAGNSNVDACNSSPARVASALTIGAVDSTDTRASFSNFGSCLDLFAPGVSITSDYNSSDTATGTMSGTSMASPHVAGAAAVVLGLNPISTPSQVTSTLLANATGNVVKNPGTSSPNLLLYSTTTVAAPATAPSAPTTVSAIAGVRKGTATVAWTQGYNGGSVLTSQTVNVYSGSTKVTSLTASASATSVSLSGLTSKAQYSFGVTATNQIGTSAETRSTVITIK